MLVKVIRKDVSWTVYCYQDGGINDLHVSMVNATGSIKGVEPCDCVYSTTEQAPKLVENAIRQIAGASMGLEEAIRLYNAGQLPPLEVREVNTSLVDRHMTP